jgi:hypothetical protein
MAVLPLGSVTVVLLDEDVCDIGSMIADWLCMMQGDECLKQFGAYVLLIELKDKFEGHVGRLGDITLPAGEYCYFGSSDCLRCPAHLLGIPSDSSAQLGKLSKTVGGKIYSAAALLPTTTAQPSIV